MTGPTVGGPREARLPGATEADCCDEAPWTIGRSVHFLSVQIPNAPQPPPAQTARDARTAKVVALTMIVPHQKAEAATYNTTQVRQWILQSDGVPLDFGRS